MNTCLFLAGKLDKESIIQKSANRIPVGLEGLFTENYYLYSLQVQFLEQ